MKIEKYYEKNGKVYTCNKYSVTAFSGSWQELSHLRDMGIELMSRTEAFRRFRDLNR